VDPIAAALGADLPTWTGKKPDPDAGPEPIGQAGAAGTGEAPPAAAEPWTANVAADPAEAVAPLVPGPMGPSDPTDRD